MLDRVGLTMMEGVFVFLIGEYPQVSCMERNEDPSNLLQPN